MEDNEWKDALVSYTSGTNSLNYMSGTTTITANNCIDYGFYQNWYPYYHTYPIYITEDKYKKAYSIVKKLLKKNLLVSRRLTDVMALIEEISQEL